MRQSGLGTRGSGLGRCDMTKTFCDLCGRELTRNFTIDRLRVSDGLIVLEVTVSRKVKNSLVKNMGDICRSCLVGIITNGHDVDVSGEPEQCT